SPDGAHALDEEEAEGAAPLPPGEAGEVLQVLAREGGHGRRSVRTGARRNVGDAPPPPHAPTPLRSPFPSPFFLSPRFSASLPPVTCASPSLTPGPRSHGSPQHPLQTRRAQPLR